MKKIHLYIYFIGKFTYIEGRHISHLEYINVLYDVSLYDFIILLCKSNSCSVSGIIFISDVQDGHKASFQCVSVPPLSIAQVTIRFHETKRKETV